MPTALELPAFFHPDHLRIGAAQTCGSLSVFPLIPTAPRAEPDYLLLDEALAKGLVRITEISENGSVPELMLHNDGAFAVLLVDGEELVGAKQNRVLNLTLLAPPKSDMRIPVSCVEAGRWSWRSQQFAGTDRALYAELREAKMRSVSASMRRGSYRSDQGEVWAGIAAKAERFAVNSATGAAEAIYESRKTGLDRIVREIRPEAGQTGAAFVVGERLVGVELFEAERPLARFLPKLLRSYGLDAMEAYPSLAPREDRSADIRGFLHTLARRVPERHPAAGLGEDWRYLGDGLNAAALVVGERLIHLSAFASKH